MKFLIKKNYIILLLTSILLFENKVHGNETKIQYSRENISNYLLGIISADQYSDAKAFDYLKKAKSVNKIHSQYNVEFIRTLILLERFMR